MGLLFWFRMYSVICSWYSRVTVCAGPLAVKGVSWRLSTGETGWEVVSKEARRGRLGGGGTGKEVWVAGKGDERL